MSPEVNLRNLLCTDEEVCMQGTHSGFDTQGRYHQESKTGVLVAPQKRTHVLQKVLEKKFFFCDLCVLQMACLWLKGITTISCCHKFVFFVNIV